VSEDISRLKEAEKENKEEKRAPDRSNQNWVVGLVLILIGAIFLFANVTDFYLDNWWALFILIPAVSNFANAWRHHQRHGRFTKTVRGSVTGGLILTVVAFTFLFDWDWGLIWPVFLIIGGMGLLLGGWLE
jgi:uncharacterized membrane protein HdeD (DUF308 family)